MGLSSSLDSVLAEVMLEEENVTWEGQLVITKTVIYYKPISNLHTVDLVNFTATLILLFSQ